MILVTGATGTTGSAVIKSLREIHAPFRAMVRNNPQPDEVVADFSDEASLKLALTGIETVFLVCAPVPDLVDLESNVIDACVASGVKYVVQLSALGAGDYSKSFPAWHRKVEDKLKASGVGHTILRPNGFFQNIVNFYAPTIRTQGAFYASMGDSKVSYLDVRDVAAAAANILASPALHAGKIYELFGPETMTYTELATRISQASGHPAKYVNIPAEVQRRSMLDMGMPAWQIDALMELQEYYVSGKAGAVTDVLPNLLGRPAVTLDEFLSEYKESFLPVGPKTGMTSAEVKRFVRDHFEEFVNRKNLDIADVNFAKDFVDHGADVPPGIPPGPACAKTYVGGAYKKFPDIRVEILDLIAEDDRVVVRNHWTGTEASTGKKCEFSGIVIWRIANRQLVERWAYLTPPAEASESV